MLDRAWENENTHTVLMRSQFKQTPAPSRASAQTHKSHTQTHTHSLRTHYIPWTEAMFTSGLGYNEVKLLCGEISSRQTEKERKIKQLTSTNSNSPHVMVKKSWFTQIREIRRC